MRRLNKRHHFGTTGFQNTTCYTGFRARIFRIFSVKWRMRRQIARRALDADTVGESAEAWRELFGDVFPKAPGDDGDKGSGKGDTPRERL